MTKPGLYVIGGVTPRMMDKMNAHFTVHMANAIPDKAAFLAQHGAEIQAVATNGADGVPTDIMAACPNLKIASCYGVGYDAVDVPAAKSAGIIITHTPNVLNNDVANTAIMLLLATSRNLVQDDAYVRAGHWETKGNTPLTTSIEQKRVGIIGLGRIGQTIARKLGAFDCDVVYHSRNKRADVDYTHYANLTEMAADCWAIIAITPGGASTNKIVNTAVMNALGPEGILINVARGSVVDQDALIAALSEGRLGRAGLDVFAAEPHVPAALRALPNVVLTPHVASATVETRQAMGDLTVDNLVQYFTNGTVISPIPECADMV
jgi:lactate dehydrogenase-like 2-hydroxyacid dehydrogenase